jgi:hypothetical protein
LRRGLNLSLAAVFARGSPRCTIWTDSPEPSEILIGEG